MSDAKLMFILLIVSIIGIIGCFLMSGCTVKLVHNPVNTQQLDKERYQIIESYRQGLSDMSEAYESEKQEAETIPWGDYETH